jgi:hypothetical protein
MPAMPPEKTAAAFVGFCCAAAAEVPSAFGIARAYTPFQKSARTEKTEQKGSTSEANSTTERDRNAG